MISTRILPSFLLCSPSLQLAQARAIRNTNHQIASCTHDVTASVVAWPVTLIQQAPVYPYPDQNTASVVVHFHKTPNASLYHILVMLDGESDLPELSSYKDKLIRQAQEQQILNSGARSVTWPDEMQYTVFFTDEVCHGIQTGRPEFTWHVERFGVQIAQCESSPTGLFRSVEFMTPEEYDAFSRRMRGQDGETINAQWRGIL
ncbi:MAG: hypothetical protein Q9166_007467 [cf. Caloplaca sp. 2 TL-2023]